MDKVFITRAFNFSAGHRLFIEGNFLSRKKTKKYLINVQTQGDTGMITG